MIPTKTEMVMRKPKMINSAVVVRSTSGMSLFSLCANRTESTTPTTKAARKRT